MKKMQNDCWGGMRKSYLWPLALFSFISFPYSDVEAAQSVTVATEVVTGVSVEDEDLIQPYFPGGTPAVVNYLSKNIVYPAQAVTEKIEGKVVLQFTITKKGRIKDVEVIKSAHPLLDAEAVCVLERMPRWVPGQKDGKPVNVKFFLPVTFKLNE